MSLVEVVCDVFLLAIFGATPKLEIFAQSFGMKGPMQLLSCQQHVRLVECGLRSLLDVLSSLVAFYGAKLIEFFGQQKPPFGTM